LDVGQELPDLGRETLGLDGDGIGEVLDVEGRRTCIGRDARSPAHRLRADASLTRGAVDAFGKEFLLLCFCALHA